MDILSKNGHLTFSSKKFKKILFSPTSLTLSLIYPIYHSLQIKNFSFFLAFELLSPFIKHNSL